MIYSGESLRWAFELRLLTVKSSFLRPDWHTNFHFHVYTTYRNTSSSIQTIITSYLFKKNKRRGAKKYQTILGLMETDQPQPVYWTRLTLGGKMVLCKTHSHRNHFYLNHKLLVMRAAGGAGDAAAP